MSNYTKNSLILFIAIFLGLCLSSCVTKYWPEIDEKYDNLLVIDGTISNQPGPYTIKLSRSSSINDPQNIPVYGFEVSVIEESGNTYHFTEKDNGTYRSGYDLRGEIGKSYKLRLESPSGEVYESDYKKINVPVEIDNVYAQIESKSDTSKIYSLRGYQFYLNSKEITQDTTYILWKLIQTYEYKAIYPLEFIYDNRRRNYVHPETLRRCWRTNTVPEVLTFKAENIKGETLEQYALNYVSTETRELSIRYSLLVQQMVIDKSAYTYWTSLGDLNTGDGSMYVQQPYQIRANVHNVEKPNEPVLGYFNVAGVSEKRIYVNRPTEAFHYQTECYLDSEGVFDLRYTDASVWPIYVSRAPDGQVGIVDPLCADCRESGGVLEKPNWWISQWDPSK